MNFSALTPSQLVIENVHRAPTEGATRSSGEFGRVVEVSADIFKDGQI